jgi:predicted ATPase
VGANPRTPPAPAAGVRIHLLGAFAVAIDDQLVPEGAWRLRKAKTLVKLLALAPGHRLHREQVIAVLWPDRAREAAANNLHQVLHVARRQLDGGAGGRRCLRLEHDVLSLCAEEELWIDAEAFRREALSALRARDPERAASVLELYPGPLLPEELYEAWTEPTRAELDGLRGELATLAAGAVGRPEAAAAASARRDNLPVELTTFVGREKELDELARLLRRGPLVTLAGPAGAGKTRLGLEIAARRRDDFRDGVWLIELAPVSEPDVIADAVAAGMGLGPGSGARGVDALLTALAGAAALIVLDNCDHLVTACAHLTEALLRGCPELQVLATSREPLQVTGEIVWRVPPLTLPDAESSASPAELMRAESVRLFVDRAGGAQPGFALTERNAKDVARICQSLDGVPLAIELAAARVGSLSPGEIALWLGESFRLLRQERRTADPRQQTLEGALDWSYRLLEPDETELLRRLAVFAGTFDLAAVEGVCGSEHPIDTLVRLVHKSLVVAEEVAGEPRYRLLSMIRRYARERLVEAGEAGALAERHARWYLALPERLREADSESRLRRLDLEPDNFRAALAWLLDNDAPAALRLTDLLGDWWLMRGRLVEGRAWLESALERSQEATPVAAAALLRAMAFVGRSGGMSEGDRLAERSFSISRELGDGDGTGSAGARRVGLDTRPLPARTRAAGRGDRGRTPCAVSARRGECEPRARARRGLGARPAERPLGARGDRRAARVAVAEVGVHVADPPRGTQVAAPGRLLVADRAELPDAERRVVARGERPGDEGRLVLARLGPDGLPELVLVAPGRDQQEIEVVAAAMQDDEPELARQGGRSLRQRVAREHRHLGRHGRGGRGDLVPLQEPAAHGHGRAWPDDLGHVLVAGPDGACRAHRSSPAGANSMIQFVSQVWPPSAENACSQRGSGVSICDQTKRTRIGLPSNVSVPSNIPMPSANEPTTGGSSRPQRRLSAQ